MLDAALESWTRWWDGVPAVFAFLLALPFVVALAGLLRLALRRGDDRPPH